MPFGYWPYDLRFLGSFRLARAVGAHPRGR